MTRNRTRYKIVRGVVILASVRTKRKGFLALARHPGSVMVRIHKTPSSWEWGPVWRTPRCKKIPQDVAQPMN